MISLAQVKAGNKGSVAQINGDSRFLSRIVSIGLTIGCSFEVLKNENKHPVLIYSRDTSIALNRIECEKIMVEVKQ